MDERIRKLERAALAGDSQAEEKLFQELVRRGGLLKRYLDGERESVWLRAFHEVVGGIDLRRSFDEITHAPRDLADEDPLVVDPLEALEREHEDMGGPLRFCFAPDEFHKANVSGGDNYNVELPCPDADFTIDGLGETFVEHLRLTFEGGGFRGRSVIEGDDASKPLPEGPLVARLAAGLLPL